MRTIVRSSSQFKGNQVKVIGTEGKIEIMNIYFSGYVYQSYNADENITTMQFRTHLPSTKWLRACFSMLADEGVEVSTNDYIIHIEPFGITIERETKQKGLNFQGNMQNIDTLNNLKKELRRVRDLLKEKGLKYFLSE